MDGGRRREKIRRETGSVQWMTDQHVVIRQDKINSHGGSQRAGSPPVVDALGAGVEHPQGSRRGREKGGSQEMRSVNCSVSSSPNSSRV